MEFSNLFYNGNCNNLVNTKMNRIKDFKNIILSNTDNYSDEEIKKLNSIINDCKDDDDCLSLISTITVDKNNIYRKLFAFDGIISKLIKNVCTNKSICDPILLKLKSFEDLIKQNPEILMDSRIDAIINHIGHCVYTMDRMCDNLTIDYVYYISPKTLHSMAIGEACENDSENRIISASDPDGSFTSVDINRCMEPIEYISAIMNEDDHDYFIHNIRFLYNYLLSLNSEYTDTDTNRFIEAVNYIMSKVINDITGKEALLDTLTKCDHLLSDITIPSSPEYLENIEIMISKIEEITEIINENPGGETSLLDEMGLGYIYEVMPKNLNSVSDMDSVIKSLVECAENDDMLSVLNESIKDKIKERIDRHKERREKEKAFKEKVKDEKYKIHNDTYDNRLEIEKRRQNDEYDDNHQAERDKYDFKQQKKQDNYDDNRDFSNQKKQDKYDFKQQKKQDKYDFKQQKKLDKYEQKKSVAAENRQMKIDNAERKRQERLEARQRRRDETKIGINRWKTLECTNANARKASNALKKAVGAGAVAGVGALAGLNPIFAGSCYLISKYVKDKTNPMAEKRKLVDDMKLQIVELDEKINMCEQRGEHEKKLELMKMKRKIQSTYNRMGHMTHMENEMTEHDMTNGGR